MIPTLQTARIKLIPLSEEHLPFRYELDSDLAVMTYLGGRVRTPEETQKAHQDQRALTQSDSGLGYWTGFVDSNPIGLFILKPPNRSDSNFQAEMGYRLLSRFWGKGFATEGSKVVLEYAFSLPGIESVCGLTETGNAGSWKTMEKLGMVHVRTFRWDVHVEGKDWVEYKISKEAWISGR